MVRMVLQVPYPCSLLTLIHMFLGFPRKRGSKGRPAPLGGVGSPHFSLFFLPPEAARKEKKGFSGTPQYCSNKNTSSIRDRKKGRKQDKEAVQMAYFCHQQNSERKDMPHDRE